MTSTAPPPPFTCELIDDGVATLVVATGEIDAATSPEFESALLIALGRSPQVKVDLAAVDFLDSSGIRTMVVVQTRAAEAGSTFGVVASSRVVDRVLDLTGLSESLAFPDA